jgi:hypothetical protein
MGSKGSPTVQNTAQTYMANPQVTGAANQAIAGAESAASQPFQMPVAPVAGFSSAQQQAFGQAESLQGAAQPYVNQAGSFNTAAGTPVTAADINAFYNPMADNVTKQLQNIFGQQNVQNQGNLTQQAGGIGADRIAVGMGNLANQQGLAAGQTYAGLEQQALQAAEWQKQQEGQAAQGALGVGNANLQTQMQGTNLLNQYGTQQQQQTQQELNAPYQNRLAQIAYQFQTPQYLAGIAGGLAPALGGTTMGQQITNPPQPSLMSQILGLGTAGVGAYGALGGSFGTGANPGSAQSPLPGLDASDYQGYGAGGNWTTPFGFADGGEVEEEQAGLTPIPMMPLKPGAGHSGPLTGSAQFSSPQSASAASNPMGDITKAIGTAAQVLPLFLKQGGDVKGYADGFEVPAGDVPDFGTMFQQPPSFKDRWGGTPYSQPVAPPQAGETNPNPVPAGTIPMPRPSPIDAPGSHPDAIRLDKGKPEADEEETPATSSGPVTITSAPPSAVLNSMMPKTAQPYPDALERDWGQNAARSPWLSLIEMGAKMASTPGPLGVSIGKGAEAGVAGLEKQRTALRSEQELNNKAQELYEKALEHIDKYNRMTPYEAASIKTQNRELDQASKTGGGKPITEMDVQRAISGMRAVPGYVSPGYAQERAAALNYIRALRGQAPAAPEPTSSVPIGTPKEFDDGKGGTVTGYWNGTTYAPKAP